MTEVNKEREDPRKNLERGRRQGEEGRHGGRKGETGQDRLKGRTKGF